jgi:hypothetical protein
VLLLGDVSTSTALLLLIKSSSIPRKATWKGGREEGGERGLGGNRDVGDVGGGRWVGAESSVSRRLFRLSLHADLSVSVLKYVTLYTSTLDPH